MKFSSFVLGLTWFLRRRLRRACVLDSQRRGEEEGEEEAGEVDTTGSVDKLANWPAVVTSHRCVD